MEKNTFLRFLRRKLSELKKKKTKKKKKSLHVTIKSFLKQGYTSESCRPITWPLMSLERDKSDVFSFFIALQ